MENEIEFRTILSHPEYEVSRCGVIRRKSTGTILSQHNKRGYMGVGFKINGKRSLHRVHRLIAEVYIPNPLNKPHINHINGIKNDNRIENLEWCTAKENIHHAIRTGLFSKPPKGESNKSAKLTDAVVLKIRSMMANGMSDKDIAATFSVSISSICNIGKGDSWSHVPCEDGTPYIPRVRQVHVRLSEVDVIEIRRLIASGQMKSRIARKFGVHVSTVNNIHSNKSWKHI